MSCRLRANRLPKDSLFHLKAYLSLKFVYWMENVAALFWPRTSYQLTKWRLQHPHSFKTHFFFHPREIWMGRQPNFSMIIIDSWKMKNSSLGQFVAPIGGCKGPINTLPDTKRPLLFHHVNFGPTKWKSMRPQSLICRLKIRHLRSVLDEPLLLSEFSVISWKSPISTDGKKYPYKTYLNTPKNCLWFSHFLKHK